MTPEEAAEVELSASDRTRAMTLLELSTTGQITARQRMELDALQTVTNRVGAARLRQSASAS